jgi:hypothetical protein
MNTSNSALWVTYKDNHPLSYTNVPTTLGMKMRADKAKTNIRIYIHSLYIYIH